MSCKVQQSVCSGCVTYAKSRIDFNNFNTFNNVEEKEIKEKMSGIKSQIVANSTEKNKAKRLIADLLAAKGEIDNAPTLVHIPLREVLGEVKGETFTIYKTEQGMVYEMTNGFMLHIPKNGFTGGLYEMLEWIVDAKDTIDKEEKDIKDFYKEMLTDISLSFSILFGMWIGSKKAIKLRNDIVERYVAFVGEHTDGADLQPADYEAEAEYEKAEKATEMLREMAKEELEKGENYGKGEDESQSHGEKD